MRLILPPHSLVSSVYEVSAPRQQSYTTWAPRSLPTPPGNNRHPITTWGWGGVTNGSVRRHALARERGRVISVEWFPPLCLTDRHSARAKVKKKSKNRRKTVESGGGRGRENSDAMWSCEVLNVLQDNKTIYKRLWYNHKYYPWEQIFMSLIWLSYGKCPVGAGEK